MSKMGKYLMLLALLPLLAIIPTGCAPTGTPTGAPTGAVAVYVTDPGPVSNVSHINITASEVKIHKAGDDGEGEWISLNITNPSFDLIALKETGLKELLAQGNVTAGNYTQIRMTIAGVNVTLDGETQNATVPSGELKFVRPFQVVDGNTTILSLDFDAGKSVTITGTSKVIVHPVVTLNVSMQKE